MNLTMTRSRSRLLWWILFVCLVSSKSSVQTALQEEGSEWSVWTPCLADQGHSMSYRFKTCGHQENPEQHHTDHQGHHDCSGTVLEVASRVCVPACETVTIQRLLDDDGHLQSIDQEDENEARCLQMAAKQSKLQQTSKNLTPSDRNTYEEFITGTLSRLIPVHTKHRWSIQEREVMEKIRMLLAPQQQDTPVHPDDFSKDIKNYEKRYPTPNQQDLQGLVNSQRGGLTINDLHKTGEPGRKESEETAPSTANKERLKGGPKPNRLQEQLGLLRNRPESRNHLSGDMEAPNLHGRHSPFRRRRGKRDVETLVIAPVVDIEVNGSMFYRVGQLFLQKGQQIKEILHRGIDTDFASHFERIGHAIGRLLSGRWNNFVEKSLPGRTAETNTTAPITGGQQPLHSFFDRLRGLLDIRNSLSGESGKPEVSVIGNNHTNNSSLSNQAADDPLDVQTTSKTAPQSDHNSLPISFQPRDIVSNTIGNQKQSKSQNGSIVAPEKDGFSLDPPEPPFNNSDVPELPRRVKREDIGMMDVLNMLGNVNTSKFSYLNIPVLDGIGKAIETMTSSRWTSSIEDKMFGSLHQFIELQDMDILKKFLKRLQGGISLDFLSYAEQLRDLASSIDNLQHPDVFRTAIESLDMLYTEQLLRDLTGLHSPIDVSRYRQLLLNLIMPLRHQYKTHDLQTFVDRLLGSYQKIITQISDNELASFMKVVLQNDQNQNLHLSRYQTFFRSLITMRKSIPGFRNLDVWMGQLQFLNSSLGQSNQTNSNLNETNTNQNETLHSVKRRQVSSQPSKKGNFAFLNHFSDLSTEGKQKTHQAISKFASATLFDMMQALRRRDEPLQNLRGLKRFHRLTSGLESYQNMSYIGELLLSINKLSPQELKESLYGSKDSKRVVAFLQRYLLGNFYEKYRNEATTHRRLLSLPDEILHMTPKISSSRNNSRLLELATHMSDNWFGHPRNEDSLYNLLMKMNLVQSLAEEYDILDSLKLLREGGFSRSDVNFSQTLVNVMVRLINRGGLNDNTTLRNLLRLIWFPQREKQNKTVYQTFMEIVQSLNHTSHRKDINMMQELSKNLQLLEEGSSVNKRTFAHFDDLMALMYVVGDEIPSFEPPSDPNLALIDFLLRNDASKNPEIDPQAFHSLARLITSLQRNSSDVLTLQDLLQELGQIGQWYESVEKFTPHMDFLDVVKHLVPNTKFNGSKDLAILANIMERARYLHPRKSIRALDHVLNALKPPDQLADIIGSLQRNADEELANGINPDLEMLNKLSSNLQSNVSTVRVLANFLLDLEALQSGTSYQESTNPHIAMSFMDSLLHILQSNVILDRGITNLQFLTKLIQDSEGHQHKGRLPILAQFLRDLQHLQMTPYLGDFDLSPANISYVDFLQLLGDAGFSEDEVLSMQHLANLTNHDNGNVSDEFLHLVKLLDLLQSSQKKTANEPELPRYSLLNMLFNSRDIYNTISDMDELRGMIPFSELLNGPLNDMFVDEISGLIDSNSTRHSLKIIKVIQFLRNAMHRGYHTSSGDIGMLQALSTLASMWQANTTASDVISYENLLKDLGSIESDQQYREKDDIEALVHFLISALGKDDWNPVEFDRLSHFADMLKNVSTAINTSEVQRMMMDIWVKPPQHPDQRYLEFLSDLQSNVHVFSDEALVKLNKLVKAHADSFKKHDPYALSDFLSIIGGSKDERYISPMHLLVSLQFLDSYEPNDILMMQNVVNIIRRLIPTLTDEDVAEITKLYTSQVDHQGPIAEYLRLMRYLALRDAVEANHSLDVLTELKLLTKGLPLFGDRGLRYENMTYDIRDLLKIFDTRNTDKGEVLKFIDTLTNEPYGPSWPWSNSVLQKLKHLALHGRLPKNLGDDMLRSLAGIFGQSRTGPHDQLMSLLDNVKEQFQDSYEPNDILMMQNVNIIRRLIPTLTDEDVAEITKLYTSQIDHQGPIAEYLRLMRYLALRDAVAANRSLDVLTELKLLTKGLPLFGDRGLRYENMTYNIQDLLRIFDTRNTDKGEILNFIDTLANEPYRLSRPWSNPVFHKLKLLVLHDHPPKNFGDDMLSSLAGIFGQSHTGPHDQLMSLLDDVKETADYQPSSIDVVAELDRYETIKQWMKDSTSVLRSYLESVNDVLGSDTQSNAASFLDFLDYTDMDMDADEFNRPILDLTNLSRIVPRPVGNARATTSIYEEVLKQFGPEVPHTSLLAFVDALQEMFSQRDIDVSKDPTTLNKMGSYLENIPLPMTAALDDIHGILIKTEGAKSYLDYMEDVLTSLTGMGTGVLPKLESLQDLENNGLVDLLQRSSSPLVDKAILEYLDKLLGQKTSAEMFAAGLEATLQNEGMRNDINFYQTSALLNNYQKDIIKTVAFQQYFGDLCDIVDVIGQYSTLKESVQIPGSDLLDLFGDVQEFPHETFTGELLQDMRTFQENIPAYGNNLENTIQLLASIFDLTSPEFINENGILLKAFTDIAIHSENITKDESKLLYQRIAEHFEEPSEHNFMELLGNITLMLLANPEIETDEHLLNMIEGIDWITYKNQELKKVRNIFDELIGIQGLWRQTAGEILQIFTSLLVPSSNNITEQDKLDLFELFEGIAHNDDEASRNDTITLYELIHNKFLEVPYNFSQDTIEELLSISDTPSRDKISNKLFLKLVDRFSAVKNYTYQMKLVQRLYHDDELRGIQELLKQNASEILRIFASLLVPSSNNITEQGKSDLFELFEGIAHVDDEASRNDTITLYELIHNKFLEVPYNFSQDTIEELLSISDTPSRDKISNKLFLKLVDRFSAVKNYTYQMKLVQRLYHVDEIRGIQELLKQNASEILRFFTPLLVLSSKEITEREKSDLFELFEGIAHVDDEASRNDTITLYEVIHTNILEGPYNFSRKTIEELLSIINTASIGKISDKLFLKLVDRLAAVMNATHQMKLVQRLFHDMVSSIPIRYNKTLSRIVEDLLLHENKIIIDDIPLLHEYERMLPVMDFIEKIFNESQIRSTQDIVEMYDAIRHQVPNDISFQELARYFADFQDIVDQRRTPNDLIQLLEKIAPASEDISRNETVTLFEEIHKKFHEVPTNFSREMMQHILSILNYTHEEKLSDKLLLQLVDRFIGVKNDSQQRKMVHQLFEDILASVSWSYNETMTRLIEDILHLHRKRKLFPVLHFILTILATNETEIRYEQENMKIYDAMNRHLAIPISFKDFTRYLDSIQDFVDSGNKNDLLDVLETIYPVSENASRNKTLALFKLITRTFNEPVFSRSPIKDLISFLRNASRKQFRQKILNSKADDMLFLRLVDKLKIVKNVSKERLLLRRTFNDMIFRVSMRYNRTISSILEDILLLHQHEGMPPVLDFLLKLGASNQSRIRNKEANLKMFDDMNRQVPNRFQLPDFTRFLKDLQYFGEPRAPEFNDSTLVSFLQNASNFRYLKPSKSKWVDYFRLITNTSASATEDVLRTFDTLVKQSRQGTALLSVDQGTELINILKNISDGQWIHRDESSWRRIYDSFENASSASQGKHLNEFIKHLFGEFRNETKVDLSDGIFLDMIEGLQNKSLLTRDRVLQWMEALRAIREISLKELRHTLGSLLEIMSSLDAVLERPQPYPSSNEEMLGFFQNITKLSMSLQKSDSLNNFNEMMHRMKQTEDELYPGAIKGNRRLLLQLDSLFNPEEFERKKREHVLLEFLLKIPRLLNASELDDGDMMALQQINDFDYFDYSIYEERPPEDNREKGALVDGILGVMQKLVRVNLNVWNNSFPQFIGQSPSTSQQGISDLHRMYYSLAEGIRMMSKAFHGIVSLLQNQALTVEPEPMTTSPETKDLDNFLNHISNMSQLETEQDLTLTIQRFSQLTTIVKNSNGSELEDVVGVFSSLFGPRRGKTDDWRLKNTDSIDKWSEWTAWSTCSVTCGHGEHVRRRTCSISIEGLLIASDQCVGKAEVMSECQVECQEGSWEGWSFWSGCDNRCGVGNQTRSRLCGWNHTETNAIHPVNHFCNGYSEERKLCREYDFHECSLHDIFVPGTWSEWSAWTKCPDVCKGYRDRQRSCHPLNETIPRINRMKRDEGLLCEGDAKENVSCEYSTVCWKKMHPVIIASWTAWSPWSQCSNRCGVGNQTRSRRCLLTNHGVTMATHHGNHSCYGDYQEKRTCSEYDFDECTLHDIFVPGTWTEWSQWSKCSENCTGQRNRHRLCHSSTEQTAMITRMKRETGLLCEGNSTQNSSCTSSDCEKSFNTSVVTEKIVNTSVVTASWTAWSLWFQCSNRCGVGNQTRSRRCRLTNQDVPMATHHGNHSCYGDSQEKRTCSEYDFDECTLHDLFVPGTWTEWGQWSNCSENCSGHRNRNRQRLCHPLKEQTSMIPRMKRDKGLLCKGNSTQNSSCLSSDCERSFNTSSLIAIVHHHHQFEWQITSKPVVVALAMIGFVLFVILIIWYFATTSRKRGNKPYRTNRGNSAPSVFQTKRSSSEGSRRSSSTRSFLSWRSKSKESALFSDQQSEESARLLDNEEVPQDLSRFCPYRGRSLSSKDDISAEWLYPWETEGDDWAGLDFETDNASNINFDVYMEVDESVEEPHISVVSSEGEPLAGGNRAEDEQETKIVELEKSAEVWFD